MRFLKLLEEKMSLIYKEAMNIVLLSLLIYLSEIMLLMLYD